MSKINKNQIRIDKNCDLIKNSSSLVKGDESIFSENTWNKLKGFHKNEKELMDKLKIKNDKRGVKK